MSNSIFHVRPLDSGKGWAIDEYDGRGAWQHSVPIGPDGAPMDKIQAQRAVFQLRRKAINSAPKADPVNKPDAALVDAAAGARKLLSKLESRIEITDELCEEIRHAESALWDALFPGAAASAGGGQ